MLDTILIGTSGMLVNSEALKVVGNNLANVNTPGFKGSQLEFANLFEQGANPNQAQGQSLSAGQGQGVAMTRTAINFNAGSDLSTGDPLNAKINGNGFFVVKHGDEYVYTRDGDFALNADGILVTNSGDHVQALDSAGRLGDVSVASLAHNMPKTTSTIEFAGNLSSTVSSPAIDAKVSGVPAYDATGAVQNLNLSFHNNGDGSFAVAVTDAAGTSIGSGTIKFGSAGAPQAGFSTVAISVRSASGTLFPVTLDFSTSVISIGSANSIVFKSQDGYAGGERTGQLIDPDGYLTIQYSNGQTQQGPRLALADFQSAADLQEAGGSLFRATATATARLGYAGDDTFGNLLSGHREGSNVNLAEEFSELILMQRGYQAASHVVSVANDMIQELFDMKGHR